MRTNCMAVAMACVLALTALASGAQAASLYFDAAGGTPTWDDGVSQTNWSSSSGNSYNQLWASGSDAYFEGTAGAVNVSGTISSANSINFTTPGYSIGGGPVTLTGSGAVTADSGTSTIASQILSTVGLTKTGAGTVVLTGNNNFSGPININNGTLQFVSADPLPGYGQVIVNDGGTVAINTNYGGAAVWGYDRIGNLVSDGSIWIGGTLAIDTTYGDYTHDDHGINRNKLRGQMALSKIGTGTLTLATANDYHGGTKIYAGTLVAPTTAMLPGYDKTVNNGGSDPNTYRGISLHSGGTLAINVGGAGEWTVDNIGGFITYGDQYAGGYLALDTTHGDFTLNGTGSNQVRGQVGLSKIGTGTLTLSDTATQNYKGGTKIYAGTVRAPTAASLPGYDQPTAGTGTDTYHGVSVYNGGTLAVNVGGASGWTVDNIGGFITHGDQYAGSQLAIDTSNGDFTYDGTGGNQIRGQVGLTKIGANKLILATDLGYHGATVVSQGNLVVNAYNGLSSGVSVTAGAVLSGYGTVLSVSGAGKVAPGDTIAGILTSDSVDPSGGLSLAVRLTQTGSPVYGNQSDSKNDVLRLAGSNPLPTGALTSANVIDVCFGVGGLNVGDQFRGGVYADYVPSFLDAVKGATYNYYVLGNGSGSHIVNGAGYYTLAEYNAGLGVALDTVAETANFGSGDKLGGVMQFTITAVPEPGTIVLLATGLLGLLAYAWRKRR